MNKDINEIIKKIKDELVPVGTIICYASPDCPEGYLPCDGREVLQSLYPKLYAVVKNRYGTPQNAQGFLLPDLRGLFVRGYDEAGNVDPERKFADIQEDAIQGHGHIVNSLTTSKSGNHGHNFSYYERNVGSNIGRNDLLTRNVFSYDARLQQWTSQNTAEPIHASGEHSHDIPETQALKIISSGYQKVRVDTETRPKNIALLYCIKSK